MSELPLSISRLTKKYGQIAAVSDVSFGIQPGEVFGLLGPNGAGKTTIISNIVTLQEPSSGSIKVFGIDVAKEPLAAKQMLGFVPQELIHHGFFTAREILRFHARYYGIRGAEEHIVYLLKKLQLWNHRNHLVNQMSGGMKRRLLIAKALLHEPKLLLLDEPTAGVDIELRVSLWQFIQELKKDNISILLTTHYLEEAERLCDRIGILNHGQIQLIEKTDVLVRDHALKTVTVYLRSPIPPVAHSYVTEQNEEAIVLQVPNSEPLPRVFGAVGISFDIVKDMDIRKGSLEDVMEKVLQEAQC